jgi:hypothetical protein
MRGLDQLSLAIGTAGQECPSHAARLTGWKIVHQRSGGVKNATLHDLFQDFFCRTFCGRLLWKLRKERPRMWCRIQGGKDKTGTASYSPELHPVKM